ncbi:MAG: glycine cleavage T C-terminal barrel domain-containing protein [Vicinamibacterales bacterium]
MSTAVLSPGYQAAHSGLGLITRSPGLIVLSGKDRASYLQGLLTNDITALAAGTGCYAAYLTAQGRMISDLHVYELGDTMLVTTPRETKDVLLAKFDQFIFSEDVQLGDLTDAFTVLELVGPGVAPALGQVLGAGLDGFATEPLHANRRVEVNGQAVVALRVSDAGVDGVAVIVESAFATTLADLLRAQGAVPLTEADTDALRVEGGVPLFGRDMDAETIPLEAGIETRAISFTKGCYVGQEVIIRVLHRGHGRVARKLVGLRFEPDAAVPSAGTALQNDGAAVGEITSSAWSPRLQRPIALGYVKRDFTQPDTTLVTADGVRATVSVVPFAAPSAS